MMGGIAGGCLGWWRWGRWIPALAFVRVTFFRRNDGGGCLEGWFDRLTTNEKTAHYERENRFAANGENRLVANGEGGIGTDGMESGCDDESALMGLAGWAGWVG